ncbi:hypothetical protein AN958_09858 [Leucoagaricus sp. SymC.cos]|nr:hypothetical protein AN958_09858 [Leucoagaricus sp. SymC.cos]
MLENRIVGREGRNGRTAVNGSHDNKINGRFYVAFNDENIWRHKSEKLPA